MVGTPATSASESRWHGFPEVRLGVGPTAGTRGRRQATQAEHRSAAQWSRMTPERKTLDGRVVCLFRIGVLARGSWRLLGPTVEELAIESGLVEGKSEEEVAIGRDSCCPASAGVGNCAARGVRMKRSRTLILLTVVSLLAASVCLALVVGTSRASVASHNIAAAESASNVLSWNLTAVNTVRAASPREKSTGRSRALSTCRMCRRPSTTP